jgi:hypothetical protein
MLVKLNILKETPKAYQLAGDGWIPKSVLDERGLKHPYYQIKGWWLETFVNKGFEGSLNLQEKLTLKSLSLCRINHIDLPIEVRGYWKKYWKDLSNNYNYSSSGLDHYNDIGAMNDLTFQDLYCDFGF